MAYDLLPALRPREWCSIICVRVCRKWTYRGGTDDGPIQHVDLVLLDEKGNSMYGEIPGSEVEAKSPLIEGSIYVISRFRVSNAKSGYQPVDSRYMVEFTLRTVISAPMVDMPDFPKYAYNITAIGDLSSRASDTKNFVDTIGLLVEKSEAYTVHLPNKPAPTLTRHIVLRDLSYSEMKITLWGERATAFSTEAVDNAAEDKPIVVLFVGGLVKSYQGNYYVSANAASRWYFNPPIPEARQFYDSYQNQRIQIRAVPAPVSNQRGAQAPLALEEKTLRELTDLDPYDFSENGYRCTVTIARLVPNASWWFPSCNRCSKTCVPDGSGYRCNTCSTNSFKFKYKILFVATDGTEEAEMICFGDIARRMIGKPVQQILRTATNTNTYPADITRMVSLRFTFHVTLTQQSYYREQKTYQVVSVVMSHGQPNAIPHAPANENGGGPGTPGSHSLSTNTGDRSEVATPSSVTNGGVLSPVATITPPPIALSDDMSPPEKTVGEHIVKTRQPSARKRLAYPAEGIDEENDAAAASLDASPDKMQSGSTDVALKSTAPGQTRALDKKRARAASSVAGASC